MWKRLVVEDSKLYGISKWSTKVLIAHTDYFHLYVNGKYVGLVKGDFYLPAINTMYIEYDVLGDTIMTVDVYVNA